MLEKFKKDKIKIEELIDKLFTIIGSDNPIREELEALRGKAEKEIFKLAVLGQFKRGKTTLINALIGENLLPVGVLPLTSVITVLRYNNKLSVEVIFSDKREKSIGIRDIHLYATEKGNPKNEKKVSVIEVSYPSEYLKRGVEFVDTPGIGSTLIHNTEVTYNYLRNIDAGIFLLSSDLPISQTEMEFLSHVKNNVGKMFFVLNTYEHKSDIDINELKEFDKKTLREELKEKVEIYALNAKLALDGKFEKNKQKLLKSQMPKFEFVLTNFFMEEKGNVLISSLKNNLLRAIEESISYLELKQKAIQTPIEEIESKLNQFHDAAELVKEKSERAEPILKSEINKIMEIIDEASEDFIIRTGPTLLNELQNKFSELDNLRKKELVSQFQAYYLKSIEEEFEPYYKELEDKVRKRFEDVALQFSNIANKTIEDIKSLSSSIFGIKMSHAPIKNIFRMESRLYYRVEEVFSSPLDDIALLFPKFAFRKVYWKNIRDNLESHLRMNAGRVRSDFLQRLNESLMQFLETLNKKVSSLITNTEKIIKLSIKEKKTKGKKIEVLIKDINNKLKLINNFKSLVMRW